MAILEYNNGNIYYTVQGDGEPIVLIHGFGLDSRIWKKQITQLSKINKVIAYDMRGFGKSSLPNGEYSHTKDLDEILKHLNIAKAKLVGHSFGGEIAIEYALQYPDKVTELILISTSLRGMSEENSEWQELLNLGRVGDIESIRKRMLQHPTFKYLKKDSEAMNLVKEIIQDYSGFHFMNKDLREYVNSSERIKELSCPVKIIIGENDEEIQKKIANKFEKELGIKPIIIPNAGHIDILEKEELINQTHNLL